MEQRAVTSRPMIIGQILKEKRIQNGYSIYGVSDLTGLDAEAIVALEDKGEAELYKFIRYARLMGFSFLTIIDWSEKAGQNLIASGIEVVDYCDPKVDYFGSKDSEELNSKLEEVGGKIERDDINGQKPSINDFLRGRTLYRR